MGMRGQNCSIDMRGSTIALAVGMTVSIVAVALAVVAATAEGSGSVRVSSNASQINMMRGMFAGVVPAEKQGPLCDACVGIFEQVNELLNDPAFQDQAVEFARNFCGLADSVLEDAVLSAECAYMVDVYGVDFLEFIYAEGRLPDEVCTFLGACP